MLAVSQAIERPQAVTDTVPSPFWSLGFLEKGVGSRDSSEASVLGLWELPVRRVFTRPLLGVACVGGKEGVVISS